MPADEPESWRVFLAIDVPDAVRDALSGPLRGLEPLGELVRINAAERIHLTLHFLGHLPRHGVEQLPGVLAPVAGGHRGIRLSAHGVGAFPDIGRPRVLWASVASDDLPRLMRLQRELGDALRNAGVAVDDRFHPHLTLARVVRPPRTPQRALLREWEARWAATWWGEVPVERVHLLRSRLGGGPPRYTTLATFDLQ